jgi:hypothetical protein
VLVDRCRFLRDARLEIGVFAFRGDSFPLQEECLLVEDARISSYLKVIGKGVRKPEEVVGKMGANPSSRWGMPPVLDISTRNAPTP